MNRNSTEYILRANGLQPTQAYNLTTGPVPLGKDKDTPAACRPAVERMRECAELTDDLLGGTKAMMERSDVYLPRMTGEDQNDYHHRVLRANLFSYYADTLKTLASRPFGRPLSWTGETPDSMEEFLNDVDGMGRTLSALAKDILEMSIHRGMAHILVDAMGGGETLEQQMKRKVTAQLMDPLNVLDIREDVDDMGRRHVVYVRYITQMDKETDGFIPETETVIVELQKGLTKGGVPAGDGVRREYRYSETQNVWELTVEARYEPASDGGVPLLTLYSNQTGPYEAKPVLDDLAWANLAHYRSQAEHAHVMHVARLVTLVTVGWSDDDPTAYGYQEGKEMRLGPLNRINSSSPDAKASFLQPDRSMSDSFEDMGLYERECQRLGARHMQSSQRNVTATAINADEARNTSNLAAWATRLEDLLYEMCYSAGLWLGVDLEVYPMVHKDFVGQVTTPDDAIKMLTAIRHVTTPTQYVKAAQRFNVIDPAIDCEAYIAELEDYLGGAEALKAQVAYEANKSTGVEGVPDNEAAPPTPEVSEEESDEEAQG